MTWPRSIPTPSCTSSPARTQILSWKNADELFRLAHFVGVTRPGYELSDAHLPRDAVSLVEVPAMAISSSACRQRVLAGRPVWYLVPDGVVQYIGKHRLYRETPVQNSGRIVRSADRE